MATTSNAAMRQKAPFYVPLFRRQATSCQRYDAKRRDDSSLPLFFAGDPPVSNSFFAAIVAEPKIGL
jgi:hypothetical protein